VTRNAGGFGAAEHRAGSIHFFDVDEEAVEFVGVAVQAEGGIAGGFFLLGLGLGLERFECFGGYFVGGVGGVVEEAKAIPVGGVTPLGLLAFDFGEAGEGWLRFSYANSESAIAEALERLGRVLPMLS